MQDFSKRDVSSIKCVTLIVFNFQMSMNVLEGLAVMAGLARTYREATDASVNKDILEKTARSVCTIHLSVDFRIIYKMDPFLTSFKLESFAFLCVGLICN